MSCNLIRLILQMTAKNSEMAYIGAAGINFCYLFLFLVEMAQGFIVVVLFPIVYVYVLGKMIW